MDGVFMKKIITFGISVFTILSVLFLADVWQDKKVLQKNIIRLHVVANSDSAEDQAVKLQVRNVIVDYLQPIVAEFSNKEEAEKYIREHLSQLQVVAEKELRSLSNGDTVCVSLDKETFDTRVYETFSLPAGIYDTLRIEIGEGQGKNWWCVVFPSLCIPATSAEFSDTAVSSGFSDDLSNTLADGSGFRFFLLDCIGKIEKLFN